MSSRIYRWGHCAIAVAMLAGSCATLRADDEQPVAPTSSAPAQSSAAAEAVTPASKLLGATVTVRITAAKPQNKTQPVNKTDDGVDVCSGISLGGGRIVTFRRATADDRIRVTWPGGEQATARATVVDEFSSLSLLEIDRSEAPALELAESLPQIGEPVLTGAATGIEKPVISLGILGGVDRSLAGSGLPPLLQCDVRTTETSSGAAIVDRQGKLIGVVAATAVDDAADGWTYAIPISHVRRLLRARVAGEFHVLKRLRPAMGLTMGPGREEGTVQVERVDPGGPADMAGIRSGDVIRETDGRKVRSAYQAVDLILKKQPGDEVELVVDREGAAQSVKLTLESAAALGDNEPSGKGRFRVGPQLNVRALGRNQVEIQQRSRVMELSADPPAADAAPRAPRDELGMLKAQLAAFEQVINRLQGEVDKRDRQQRETDAVIKALTEEVGRLRKELEAAEKKQPQG